VTLGLEYGRVRLVPSNPQWARAFREEYARLTDALSGIPCEVEHIGSSAVAEVLAKPIVDIAVGVRDDSSAGLAITAIETLGYEYRSDAGTEGGDVLVKKSRPLVRTHHAHVVEFGGSEWEADLLFREHLEQSKEAREV
jgi:GrpB-like predicted nucleotidyltransferase (UPF0157 family)